MSVKSISTGGSIFSLWVEQPSFSNKDGIISFNGGVPNPGYKGASGKILTVVFQAKSVGTANLGFNSSAIRENDGLGTDVFTGGNKLSVNITKEIPKVVEPEVKKPVAEDPPVKKLTPVKEKAPVATTSEPVSPLLLAPVITYYPTEIKSGDHLDLRGIVNSPKVKISVLYKSEGGNVESSFVYSDEDGSFTYHSLNPLRRGLYTVWAETVVGDNRLNLPSEKVYVSVSDPWIIGFGERVRDGLALLTSIVGLIVLIIAILFYGWYRVYLVRRKYRREVSNAERQIHKAFIEMSSEARKQLDILELPKKKAKLSRKDQLAVRKLKEMVDQMDEYTRQRLEQIEDL